jgi:hypothetical protein
VFHPSCNNCKNKKIVPQLSNFQNAPRPVSILSGLTPYEFKQFKTKNFTMELRNTVICKNSFKDFVSVNICQTTHYIAVLKYLANDFMSKTTTI